jgi:hypothetical protein
MHLQFPKIFFFKCCKIRIRPVWSKYMSPPPGPWVGEDTERTRAASILTSSSGNWPFCSFRSSASGTYQWPVPLPPRGGITLTHYDSRTTNYFEYRRYTYRVTITHSPITLANLSSINLVSIFRCSSPPRKPVYVSRVDPSALVFSLSSHRQSYIGLLYSSRFIDF